MNDHAPTANHLLTQAVLFLKTLRPGPLAIAVSGGSDSMSVLLAIHEANRSARDLVCFTVDHKLREEAAGEALFVGKVCKALGVEHQTLDWVGEKPNTGIQQAARQARYKLLTDACAQKNVVGLITGHTQDDQLETVAMRASRNSSEGARGLSGMAPATLFYNTMWVLRPFLRASKVELREFLLSQNQTWIEDPSNQDDKYERVRVRKRADFTYSLPQIEKAQKQRQQNARVTAEYLSNNCQVEGGLVARLEIQLGEMPALLRSAECLIDVIGGRKRTLSGEQIEEFAKFIQSENPKRTTRLTRMTMGRAVIEKRSGTLVLRRENRNLDPDEIHPQSNMIWDRRFKIENRHQEKCLVVTSNNQANGFPPNLFWKSENIEDQIGIDEKDPHILVRRYVNRFDEVLSLLDMPIAIEVSKLFESHGFKTTPFVHDL